jgi:glycosyltransferase involved in cell wall biosynthesis
MRLVIDLQAVQATNSRRGIGRYSLALVEGILALSGDHQVVVALSGAFPTACDELSRRLRQLAPNIRIEVWYPPSDLRGAQCDDPWLRHAGEAIREEFIASLSPDVVLVTSLFEGFADPAVTSVGIVSGAPVAVVLYDLIPLVRQSDYLSDPSVEAWYHSKIGQLRRADTLLAISAATRDEALEWLDLHPNSVIEIGAGVDPIFKPGPVDDLEGRRLVGRLGLSKRFLLYTGGIDPRKNIRGLIAAYAGLRSHVRSSSQLAIVCTIRDTDRVELQHYAESLGLKAGEVVLTGYLSDADLVSLHHLSTGSVFPSLHEGFGLPALEAMACGRAVITSDRSSMPEVVGRSDALFDPTSLESMTSKLDELLSDDDFRSSLERHSIQRAQCFSWAVTARRALDVLERMATESTTQRSTVAAISATGRRPSLAYLSPLPPEESGISDYSALLLPHLFETYDVDVITDLGDVSSAWIAANCAIRSTDWFRQHHDRYDRILYHFGNSTFHDHMFHLLEKAPGIVVLHDFYLSGIISHMEALGQATRTWASDLYHSHGYEGLITDSRSGSRSDVVWRFPVNLRVLEHATGVVVHSQTSRQLADEWYGVGSSEGWRVVPMPRASITGASRDDARARLGIGTDAFVVAAFGIVGPTKLNDRLLSAFRRSALFSDSRCQLLFVGASHDSGFSNVLERTILDSGIQDRVAITGRVGAEDYAAYLAASDVGVQLRASSRGETSASAFDCLASGLATIVNANGSLTELPAETVHRIPDAFTDVDLIQALELLRSNDQLRSTLGSAGQSFARKNHSPRIAANAMVDAIEDLWRYPDNRGARAVASIARTPFGPSQSTATTNAALALSRTISPRPRAKRLFVDVSELSIRDAGSGIQRVTRSIVRELLEHPPAGYRVEPVAATTLSEFRFARTFSSELLGLPVSLTDNIVEFDRNDIFLGLDLQPLVVPAHREFFRRLRRAGTWVAFVVYDLLPIIAPESFLPGATDTYERWLTTVREADSLISISRSVQSDLQSWLERTPALDHFPHLSWFHLGSDLACEPDLVPTAPVATGGYDFLMVGTVEPRKRHGQVLSGFELLWQRGYDIRLIIAGRAGWMVEDLVERLRSHPELGKRLEWIDDAGDVELAHLYRSSTALIAASSAEGFGLPLLEAAGFGLPIIARDIPVFREIAGPHVTYFNGDDPLDLAESVEAFVQAVGTGQVTDSSLMTIATWAESTSQLVTAILANLPPA